MRSGINRYPPRIDRGGPAGAQMMRVRHVVLLSMLLGGCAEHGHGTLMGVRVSEPDAWVVTSIDTEFDRSSVPETGTIHTFDAVVTLAVAKVDAATGKSSARLRTRSSARLAVQPTEYKHELGGASFKEFRLKKAGVRAGDYIIGYILQPGANSIAMICVDEHGTPLPGVMPIRIARGETVYLGHLVPTMKLAPLPRGDVAYPAKLVGIRYVERPPGIEDRLATAGVDPSAVRFVSGATAGCRMTTLDLKLPFF